MKYFISFLILTFTLFGWETTTHRAIDRKAIKKSKNLQEFIKNSKIDKSYKFIQEEFSGYGTTTYEKYISEGEEGGISDWNQTFTGADNIRDAIEAGTILEDAQWQNAFHVGDGRFNNHFYDPQNGGKGLTYGWGGRVDAVSWATGDLYHSWARWNEYSVYAALGYFEKGFTLPQKSDRRKYQAKMLVSVGHLMHMMNDMNVPAHVRDDSHPLGDPLEVWMRGGEGANDTGFYVRGSKIANERYAGNAPTRFDVFENGMKSEANYTAAHFFSKNTIFYKPLLGDAYSPRKDDVIIPELDPDHPGDYGYVTDANGRKLAVAYWSGWFGRIRKTLDYSVESDVIHHEYGKVLIPRAIANAAGFLNYFFRGQMKAEANPCGVKVTNVSDASTVAGDDIVTFKKGGTLEVYYDNKAGERKMIGMKTLEKNLFVQDTVFVPVRFSKKEYDDMNDTKWIVVYDGDIGNKRGVSVLSVDISGLEFSDIPQAFDGAISIYLSWNYECDIDMDLDMQGPATQYDIKDIVAYGKEHAYVASVYNLYPGDRYVIGTTGEAIGDTGFENTAFDGTTFDDRLAKDPIMVLALLETPTGSYFKKWEIETIANLDIGEFAEITIEKTAGLKWTSDGGSGGGGSGGSVAGESSRYYNCSEEEKQNSCGCVPCEYLVTGMKKRVENGPISGADVEIIRASEAGENNPNVIYRTKTTDKDDIFESGLIELDNIAVDLDEYYIVTATGGKDIDYDDDMYRDVDPVVNHGTIHAIVKGSDLVLMPFRINILTEAIYQVSGDVIGSNYDAKALSSKLDNVSQKLISQKLYIKDENTTVRYADILLWTPVIDKRSLYKPFDIFVKPIIDKLYADQERYKESYTLIYDEYDSGAPQLKPQVLNIPQGLPNGTIIAKLSTINQKSFSKILFEGTFSEQFNIDDKGLIHVTQSEQIKEGNVYHFQMYAIGDDGKEGARVSLDINIDGIYEVAYPDKSIPMFEDVYIYDLTENAPAKTKVADVYFSDTSANIVQYVLSGDAADNFDIDEYGHITVASGANIDYEKSKIYSFKIQAINDVGNSSYPVTIEIAVNNEIDTPIFDQEIFVHVEENTPVGSIVTQIREDREGKGSVEKFEILNPNIPFSIDSNGTIMISQPIDYEQKSSYNFYAIAVTPYGNSNKIEINIIVDDQEPEVGTPHIQNSLTVNISEDTPSETKIGTLDIDEGSEPIEKIVWYGIGKEYFTIDMNGSIYVQAGCHLDYETATRYDLGVRALNARGWGNEVYITIHITNVPELPILKPLNATFDENIERGDSIGVVEVKDHGDKPVSQYKLSGTTLFEIDEMGTIILGSQSICSSQREYHFQVQAYSELGWSKPVDVNLTQRFLGHARFGYLGDANVSIYKIEENGTKTLQWQEVTTNGDTLDEVGEFFSHYCELESQRFYLYDVRGGENWDIDNDGYKDANSTSNGGVGRLLVKGSDILSLDRSFNISMVSEAVYEKAARKLKYAFDEETLPAYLDEKAATVTTDIDGDGDVNMKDVLLFDPVKDRSFLADLYRAKFKDIASGQRVLINMDNILGSTHFTFGYPAGFKIASNSSRAFVTDYSYGLSIIDFDDPVLPVRTAQLDLLHIWDVVLSPDEYYAYVVGEEGVYIVDVTDANAPFLLSTIEISGYISAVAVTADEKRMFVSDQDNVKVYDITDHSNPVLVDTLDIADVTKIVISQDMTTLFVRTSSNEVRIYHMESSGEVILSAVVENESYIGDIAVSSDLQTLYLGSSNKIDIIDIRDTNQPSKQYTIETDETYVYGLKVSKDDRKIYLSGSKGVKIIDVSNRTEPYLLKDIPLNIYSAIEVSEDNKRIYQWGGLFSIIDISDMENYLQIKTFDIADNAARTVLLDDKKRVYLPGRSLQIIDMSDPLYPVKLNDMDLPNFAQYAILSSDSTRLYLLSNYHGLQIIDSSDVKNPVLIGTLEDIDYAYDMILSWDETKIYAGTSNNHLQVIDVKDPRSPALGSSFHMGYGGTPMHLTLGSKPNELIVADGENGVLVINISDSDNPYILSSIDTGWIRDVVYYPGQERVYALDQKEVDVIRMSTNSSLEYLSSNAMIKGDTIDLKEHVSLLSVYSVINDQLHIFDISSSENIEKFGSFTGKGVLSEDGMYLYLIDGDVLRIFDLELFW